MTAQALRRLHAELRERRLDPARHIGEVTAEQHGGDALLHVQTSAELVEIIERHLPAEEYFAWVLETVTEALAEGGGA